MVNGYNIGVGGKGRVFYRIVQRIKIRLDVFNGELWGHATSNGQYDAASGDEADIWSEMMRIVGNRAI
jgi:hypothetical protein